MEDAAGTNNLWRKQRVDLQSPQKNLAPVGLEHPKGMLNDIATLGVVTLESYFNSVCEIINNTIH